MHEIYLVNYNFAPEFIELPYSVSSHPSANESFSRAVGCVSMIYVVEC